MNTSELLSALITVSERAGNIVRLCQIDENLLSLLVQEKKDSEKNPRFEADFKTLADVLIQEMVKHYLCSQFPSLQGHIYGEENNQFGSGEETITVEVKPTVEETADLLNKVIKNYDASKTLSEALYSPVTAPDYIIDKELPSLPDNLGIWIDPIDATAEYLDRKGCIIEKDNGMIYCGIPCVTVLLGVFDRDSGLPLVGVINQPFGKQKDRIWSGRCFFGVSYNGFKFSPPIAQLEDPKAIAISSSERKKIKQIILDNGYKTYPIAGAGFKLLNIILGYVSAFILTQPTSYLWDICACHAVLDSIGGGIVNYNDFSPIKYKGKGEIDCCNSKGIIAYRNADVRDEMKKLRRQIELAEMEVVGDDLSDV